MATRSRAPAVALVLIVLVGGALAFGVHRALSPPDGPVPVAWDHEACARCRMLVSDPAFAAQLHTTDGRVLHFDDPGCLFLHLHDEVADVHAVFFHEVGGPGWVSSDDVVFVPAEPTPMGYGLGARRANAAEGMDLDAALLHVLAREGRAGARP